MRYECMTKTAMESVRSGVLTVCTLSPFSHRGIVVGEDVGFDTRQEKEKKIDVRAILGIE